MIGEDDLSRSPGEDDSLEEPVHRDRGRGSAVHDRAPAGFVGVPDREDAPSDSGTWTTSSDPEIAVVTAGAVGGHPPTHVKTSIEGSITASSAGSKPLVVTSSIAEG